MQKVKELYPDLEMLESDWKEYLEMLTSPIVKFGDSTETAYEQLLVYLVYRHLSAGDIYGTLKFCVVSYMVICRICEAMGGTESSLKEICRRTTVTKVPGVARILYYNFRKTNFLMTPPDYTL